MRDVSDQEINQDDEKKENKEDPGHPYEYDHNFGAENVQLSSSGIVLDIIPVEVSWVIQLAHSVLEHPITKHPDIVFRSHLPCYPHICCSLIIRYQIIANTLQQHRTYTQQTTKEY